MRSKTLVSVEEYLCTSYEPDCDFVDGELLERHLGERDHSVVVREFLLFFRMRQEEWKTFAYPEQRVQVSAHRFRIPDVCVYAGVDPKEQVFRSPPFICIEVLSPEDRLERMQDRIDDYLRFGVPNVWVINPRTRRAWVHTADGSREVKNAILATRNPDLQVSLAEIFSAL